MKLAVMLTCYIQGMVSAVEARGISLDMPSLGLGGVWTSSGGPLTGLENMWAALYIGQGMQNSYAIHICKMLTYTRLKRSYNFGEYLSNMKNCQLRKTVSRSRCGSHWLQCATRFFTPNLNEQSCPACLDGRVGGEHETKHHAMFSCDAYYHIRRNHKFQQLFADQQAETLCTLYEKNEYTLIA